MFVNFEERERERERDYICHVRKRFQKNKINTRARALVPSHTHTPLYITFYLPFEVREDTLLVIFCK